VWGDGQAAPATVLSLPLAAASDPVLCGGVVVLVARVREVAGARRPALLSSAAVQPPVFAAS